MKWKKEDLEREIISHEVSLDSEDDREWSAKIKDGTNQLKNQKLKQKKPKVKEDKAREEFGSDEARESFYKDVFIEESNEDYDYNDFL